MKYNVNILVYLDLYREGLGSGRRPSPLAHSGKSKLFQNFATLAELCVFAPQKFASSNLTGFVIKVKTHTGWVFTLVQGARFELAKA
jgi:hypothetical protein